MGTLYDLLGALPSDDAEELRTAFRKAAKATHPDTNPDNPDAAVRFRELVRAYDILTDADQRSTYDQLLVIALQPSTTPATRTYETVRKVASNTMAASVILAALVGGYAVFGLFSKPPGAAEMLTDETGGVLEDSRRCTLRPRAGRTRAARRGDRGDDDRLGGRRDRPGDCAEGRPPPPRSAASNVCPPSPATIWEAIFIRASQPPISTAA